MSFSYTYSQADLAKAMTPTAVSLASLTIGMDGFTVTATTSASAPHGVTPNGLVTIAGATGSDGLIYNGVQTVTQRVSATVFKYVVNVTPSTNASGILTSTPDKVTNLINMLNQLFTDISTKVGGSIDNTNVINKFCIDELIASQAIQSSAIATTSFIPTAKFQKSSIDNSLIADGTVAGTNLIASSKLHFSINPLESWYWVGNGVYATKNITSIVHVGTLATVTLAGHGYLNGNKVVIAGVTVGSGTDWYNGTFIVTPLNSNQFTYVMGGTPSVDADAGTGTAMEYQKVFIGSSYLTTSPIALIIFPILTGADTDPRPVICIDKNGDGSGWVCIDSANNVLTDVVTGSDHKVVSAVTYYGVYLGNGSTINDSVYKATAVYYALAICGTPVTATVTN